MKKCWTIFRLTEGALILIYILLCIHAGRLLITAGIVLVLLSVYWFGYYYKLKYTLSNNTIGITSGIIFQKHRRIPLSNILWEMRLTSPLFKGSKGSEGSAMSVLHTSGGNAVLFCDFSTHRR